MNKKYSVVFVLYINSIKIKNKQESISLIQTQESPSHPSTFQYTLPVLG